MKFTTPVASALLLASAAWASPLSARAAAAGKSLRRTNFKIPVNVSDDEFAVQQSSNWGGAALTTSGVTEVTGTFTIPKPTVPSGGSTR